VTLSFLEKVPAGYVGVKVNLLGSDKGVAEEELSPGRYIIGINEELFLFPTFDKTDEWTQDVTEKSATNQSILFQTREGLSVSADVGITYSIEPGKATAVFQRFRLGIEETSDQFLRNWIRDSLVTHASTLRVEQVYGEGKTQLMRDVYKTISEQVSHIGIQVKKLYWIGNLRLPPAVVEGINAKIAATQKSDQRRNEIEQTKNEARKEHEKSIGLANVKREQADALLYAEKSRADAAAYATKEQANAQAYATREQAKADAEGIFLRAQARAKANTLLSKTLTPELIKYHTIKRWSGNLPRFTGDGPLPFIEVKDTK